LQTRSQATKAKARASKKAAMPSTHVYPHPRKPERAQELKREQITKPGAYMMETLVRKAKLPTQRQYGVPFLAAPCPIDGSHTDGDTLVLQLGPDKLFCPARP